MNPDNVDTIRRIYDALRSRDLAALQAAFAADVEVSQTPELPWGGTYHGHDGLFTFFAALIEHVASQVVEENLFAAGDHVVQTGRTQGTVLANGAAFDVPEVHVWTVRDGKVIRYESYIDTPAMLDALQRPPT